METLFISKNHAAHAEIWTIKFNKEILCLACCTELLQSEELINIKKKRVLSGFLQLITKEFSSVSLVLQQDGRVAQHLAFIFIDLMKIDDQTFQSVSIEGCVKLVCGLENEDLLERVLQRVTQESVSSKKSEDCHAHLILIGRLLHVIPALATRLLQDYGEFIDDIGSNLCDNNDETLSAITYILSYLFKCEEVSQYLPERLCVQVQHAVVFHLGSAKNHDVTLNLLGLLKRLLADVNRCHDMLSLTINGMTLCSVVKRLLLSRDDVYQMAAVQCIQQLMIGQYRLKHAEVVLDADIAEFLFEIVNKVNCAHLEVTIECLIALTEAEQFFTRCHSLYGMDPLLRALEASLKQRHMNVVKPAFKLLAILLERQPAKLTLLTSCASVDNALDVIHKGISHHNYSVIVSAMIAFGYIMRKCHVHIPIAFSKLSAMLIRVCERVKSLHKLPDIIDKRSTSCGQKKMDVLKLFYGVVLSASRLIGECEGEAIVCQEMFTAPDTHETTTVTSLDHFSQVIHDTCDEHCIPMIMINWSCIENADIFTLFYRLLTDVTKRNNERTLNTQDKLISAGFLSSTFQMKAQFRACSELVKAINDYWAILSSYLCYKHGFNIPDDIIPHGLCVITGTMKEMIHSVLPSQQDPSVHASFLLIVYTCYLNGDSCLHEDDLTSYLGLYLSQEISITCLPVQLYKCFTFLIAVAYEQFGIEANHNNLQEMFTAMSHGLEEESLDQSQIFIEHPVILRWVFSSQFLTEMCSTKVMLCHLSYLNTCTNDVTESMLSNKPIFSPVLSDLLPNPLFRSTLQEILSSEAETRVKSLVISFLLHAYQKMDQSRDSSLEVIQWYRSTLPSLFLSALIGSTHTFEGCLFDTLPLLALLREGNSVILPQELKILSSAISQLTKTHTVSDDVQIACLHYISLFYQQCDVNDVTKRVSGMVIQNHLLLKKLEHFVKDGGTLQHIALDIIHNLMINVDSCPESACTINISANSVIKNLVSLNKALQLSTIQFLDDYFANTENSLVAFNTSWPTPLTSSAQSIQDIQTSSNNVKLNTLCSRPISLLESQNMQPQNGQHHKTKSSNKNSFAAPIDVPNIHFRTPNTANFNVPENICNITSNTIITPSTIVKSTASIGPSYDVTDIQMKYCTTTKPNDASALKTKAKTNVLNDIASKVSHSQSYDVNMFIPEDSRSILHTTTNTATNTKTQATDMDEDTLTSIWIYLQQSCLQDEPEIRDCAMKCMGSLLKAQSQTIGDKLLSNPWNHFLLECLIHSDNLSFPLRFIIMLMSTEANVIKHGILAYILDAFNNYRQDDVQTHCLMKQILPKFPEAIKSSSQFCKAVEKLENRSMTLL